MIHSSQWGAIITPYLLNMLLVNVKRKLKWEMTYSCPFISKSRKLSIFFSIWTSTYHFLGKTPEKNVEKPAIHTYDDRKLTPKEFKENLYPDEENNGSFKRFPPHFEGAMKIVALDCEMVCKYVSLSPHHYFTSLSSQHCSFISLAIAHLLPFNISKSIPLHHSFWHSW